MQPKQDKQPEQVPELKFKKPIIYIIPTENMPSVLQPPLLPTSQMRDCSGIVEANTEEFNLIKKNSLWSELKKILNTEIIIDSIEIRTGFIQFSIHPIWANSEKNLISEKMTVDVGNILERISIDYWHNFVELIPYSVGVQDYEFPPGHPMPGRFYRVHPLPPKNRKYIPLENFDTLLFSERENELIRLLVDLGATKISIQEVSSGTTEGSIKSGASVQGAVGIQANLTAKNEQSNTESRVILLRGKPWASDMSFNEKEYSWLPYEPAWESLVHARLKGGCLSASVELTSDASYSVSGKLGLTEGILEQLGAFGVGANLAQVRQVKKLFLVEFADTLPDSETPKTYSS
ncbi:hypothetical protein [Funiculus sociatus]|uniref:hypothetical protein n=1 Tax=Funiculus sociatus TaxID=450527 RepID=UPI003296EC28